MTCLNCTCDECRRVLAPRKDKAAQAAELRAGGMTIARIVQALGSNHTTVRKLLQEAGSHTASA